MSINATFYSFDKRKNSTKIPTGAGDVVAVDLKSGVDLINPSFLISINNIPTWNYMLFEGRYYFITDVISVRTELWEISASVDVLATYKSDILDMSAFVKYHSHTNTEISDMRLSTKTTATYHANSGTFDLLGSSAGVNNAVVVNVVGENSVCAYAMSQEIARTLTSNFDNWYEDDDVMPGPPNDNPFIDIVHGLTYMANAIWYACRQFFSMGSAKDCIRSAIMLPIPVSAVAGTPQEISLGKYDTDKTGTRIGDRIFSDGCDVTIPWQTTDWRRNAPYTEIYLYIPYIGLISISPSDVIDCNTLHVSVNMDYNSGDTIFTVYTESLNHVIGQYNTNIGAPYPIGSSNITPSSVMTAVGSVGVTVAGAALTGGSSLAMMSTGFLGLQNSISPQPNCIGGACGGAGMGIDNNVRCYVVFHDTTVNPNNISALQGTPTNASMSMENINGYVQTVDFSVAGTMTGTEKDLINDMMDGGVYIE